MYGAKRKAAGVKLKDDEWVKKDMGIEDVDPIYDMFSEKKMKKTNFKHNVWAKFEGKGAERLSGEEVHSLSKVTMGDKRNI